MVAGYLFFTLNTGGFFGITLDPHADTAVESDESIKLTLTHPSSGADYNLGTAGAVTATIVNDDFAAGTDTSLPNVTLGLSSAPAVYESAGQALGTGPVLDTSKYLNQVLAIDPDRRTARVQPGVVLDELNAALKPHNLRFAPDVSSARAMSLSCSASAIPAQATPATTSRPSPLRMRAARACVAFPSG